MEYQVFLLDPQWRLCHYEDQLPLLETDDLGIACHFASEHYKKNAQAICVYQPRHKSYRDHYMPWDINEPEDFSEVD